MHSRFMFALMLTLLVPPVMVGSQSNRPAVAQSAQAIDSKSLLQRGFQQLYASQAKPAIASFQQAIALSKQSGDRTTESAALLGLSETKLMSGRAEESLTIAQQALKIYREIGDRKGEAAALSQIGDAQGGLSQNEASLSTLQQSLAIWREIKDRQNEAWTLGIFGIVQTRQDQKAGLVTMQQAIAMLREPVAPIDQLRQQYRQGMSLTLIGRAQIKEKQIEVATKTLQEALELGRKSENLTVQLSALSVFGELYKSQKQFKEAIVSYQQASALAQQLENRSTEAYIYGEIGSLFGQLKQYSKAQQAYQKALTLYQAELSDAQKSSARASEGIAQLQIGVVYLQQGLLAYQQGQYQSAIDSSTKSLPFLEQSVVVSRDLKAVSLTKTAQQFRSMNYGIIVLSHVALRQYDLATAANQKQYAIAKETGSSELEQSAMSLTLNIQADLFNSLDDPTQYDKKLEAGQQVVSILQKLKQPKDELVFLSGIGDIYQFQGRFAEALAINQQIVTRAREFRDVDSETVALLGIANLYDIQANYPQALAINQQALDVTRQNRGRQKPTLEATVLNSIALIYKKQGQYPQALSLLQQVLKTVQKYYELYAKDVTLDSIQAICLEDANSRDSAKASTSDSTPLEEYCKNPSQLPTGDLLNSFKERIASNKQYGLVLVGSTLDNIAAVYTNQGELQKAFALHQKALVIRRQTGDRRREAITLSNISLLHRDLADYPKAIDAIQQALKIAIELNDRSSEIAYRLNLGGIKSDTGRYAEASTEYQQSLKLSRQFKARYEESTILSLIASNYFSQGKYADALKTYEQTLKIQQEINVSADVLINLGNVGNVYTSLGQYTKAVEYKQQALAIARKIGARRAEADVLLQLSEDDRLQGKFDSALRYQQQALSIAQSIQARLVESDSLQAIGKLYNKQSQPQKALDPLQKALTIARETGRKPSEAGILREVGQAQLQLGQLSEAQESLQQAIALSRETGDAPIEAQSLSILAESFKSQPELAIVFYKQSVNLQEDLRKGLRTLPRDQQESYTQVVATTYRNLADLLMAQGRLSEAQKVLELLKIQELQEFSRGTPIQASQGSIALFQSEQKILDQYKTVAAFAQKLNECEQTKCPQLKELRDQLDQLNNAFNGEASAFQKELRSRLAQDPGFLTADQVGNKAIDIVAEPGTAMVYPLVLQDKIRILYAVKAGQSGVVFRTVEIPKVGQAQLWQAVNSLSKQLKNPNSDLKTLQKTSAQLYDWLIRPLEPELASGKIEHLVFALDRATRYIPMAVLYDSTQQKYLIERYAVSTVLSAELTDVSDRLPAPDKTSVLAFGLSKSVQGFPALSNVPSEISSIVKSDRPGDNQGVYQGSAYLNDDFDYDMVRDHLAGHKILHLATHGQFKPGDQSQSYLVAGKGENLTLETISKLRNYMQGVHLVVLSACETGIGGPDSNGIELPGIGFIFLQARAKSVLASLWQVNDASTSLLMQQFYRHLATSTQPMTKSEALREAQLSLLQGKLTAKDAPQRAGLLRDTPQIVRSRSSNFSHPFYWAPFILIGNGL